MWSSDMERIVISPRKPLAPRKAVALAAAVGLAAALSACASAGGPTGPEPLTPTEQFSIEVKPQPQELRLAVHGAGVSQNQAQALGVFARQWAQGAGGEITLQSPARTQDQGAAYRTAVGARDVLVASGVASDKVRIVSYEPTAGGEAPVIVSYVRYAATAAQCGQSWENITATAKNRPTSNFGCAVTANMAAQVADPGDFAQPREETAADAGRRQTVLDHYRKGEVTSSAKDNQADGAISRAIP
jgi:pilus assembly protein CpaD